MQKRHFPRTVALLGIALLAGTLSTRSIIAQLEEGFSWPTASCEERKEKFKTLVEEGMVANLLWVYDGVLSDVIDPSCAFLGSVQGVGYVTDPELLIDPQTQEQLYYAPDHGIFFVSFLEKRSVSYVFRIKGPVMPDEYMRTKPKALLQNIAIGRALHDDMIASETGSGSTQEPAGSGTVLPLKTASGAPVQESSSSATLPSPVSTSPAAPLSQSGVEISQAAETSMASGTVRGTNDAEETSSSSSVPPRIFYREGKVVRTNTPVSVMAEQNIPEPAVPVELTPVEEDPLLQQLLEEQEKIIATDEGTKEPEQEEKAPKGEAAKPSAPEKSSGMGLATVLGGAFAVLLGVVFPLFMLKRKKKELVPGEEIPPTPQPVTEAPQQESERLKQALAETDGNAAS